MNPELANVNSLSVRSVSITPTTGPNHDQATSVSGYLYAFIIVGIAANISAMMLKIIAILPTFVINHKIRPNTDNAPQKISNADNFQIAFLLKKVAIKIKNGKNPTLKVMSDSIPIPCFICAAKAISGATDHKRKDTLLGFTLPLTVSIR